MEKRESSAFKRLTLRLMAALAFILIAGTAYCAETAQQVMTRASTAFRNARSIQCQFSMSGSLGSYSGTYSCAGRKFAVVTGSVGCWYDGKNMWSYNPRTGETTLDAPSASEAAQANPFSVISAMGTGFNATYAKNQPAGSIVLVLIPKAARKDIRKAVLTLDKKRLTPKKIVITSGAGTSTVTVGKYVANINIASSTFTYPRKKYPKARIVDLR